MQDPGRMTRFVDTFLRASRKAEIFRSKKNIDNQSSKGDKLFFSKPKLANSKIKSITNNPKNRLVAFKMLGPRSEGAVQGRSTICDILPGIPKDPNLNRSAGPFRDLDIEN